MQNTAVWKLKQVPYLIAGIDSHKKRRAALAIIQDLAPRKIQVGQYERGAGILGTSGQNGDDEIIISIEF